MAAMRSVLAELEPLVTGDAPPELAAELKYTQQQLANMLRELTEADSGEP